MQTNYFYIPVFLTQDGKIYVDFSSRNKEDKIIFHRINANEIVNNEKEQDWNIHKEINNILFYLQKDGLVIEDISIPMITTVNEISDDLIERENYYFTVVKKISKSVYNENIVLMELEDFLADENIHLSEKLAVTIYYNGEAPEVY